MKSNKANIAPSLTKSFESKRAIKEGETRVFRLKAPPNNMASIAVLGAIGRVPGFQAVRLGVSINQPSSARKPIVAIVSPATKSTIDLDVSIRLRIMLII